MILITSVSVNVGDQVSCKYPKNGNRNILATKAGVVEAVGTGPAGDYFTIKMLSGQFRTLSLKRAVDLVVS